ncbi:hypothetical protein PVAND_015411 [Polypedilum vanderplanki]|uniref:Uncharacterized protein n=1 Tax=Polypedilum vanderplanki TaxID=319348 RepID=A0A9J6BCR4_POLVA|nr:hypothetical protein PVAND_015411 [Polypedilum vanderplanki]
MSIKKVRNEKFQPFIEDEGFFMDSEPHLRLYHHNTLSSARRHANFVNVKSPADSLDVILASEYDHSNDLFLDKEEVFKQPETKDKPTFRRLRNTRDVYIKPPVYLSHPLVKGGITERLSIHSVKLINSGPHSQITNHGFSRQNVDGNFYNY